MENKNRATNIKILKIFGYIFLVLFILVVILAVNSGGNRAAKSSTQQTVKEKNIDNDLKSYRTLTIDERHGLNAKMVSKMYDLNITESSELDNLIIKFDNCMGDFTYNKNNDLKYTEVLDWCYIEYKNLELREAKFNKHFNELDAIDLKVETQILCQQLVKGELKSPSTADFPWTAQTYRKGKNRWVINSYVDSQNGFGATIRTNYFCDVSYKGSGDVQSGNNWTLNKLEFQ